MTGIYTRVCAGLLFPLHEHFKGHDSVSVRRRLEESQWWSAERIEADQASRLRSFLIDVGRHVPYYRELFRRVAFEPANIRSAADLQRLPLTGKSEIRTHLESLKAEDHGPLTRYNTGGSSGEPLIFFIGKARKSHDVAAKWRATRWWSVDIGDPEIVVWGSPIELGAQDRIRRLRDKFMRSSLVPAFEMSEPKLDDFVASIRHHRPRMLFGYPSALARIAGHAQSRGVRLDDLGVKVVFVTSERLYDDQRASIARAFDCPVANGYGGRDAGFIAHECPAGGMHISAEDIVVELIDAEGGLVPDGAPGEVVVTHLATRDFPFIRYRTGDVAVRGGSRCACGRGLPLLKEIHGRSTDFVVASDGTVMHGLALIYVLREMPGIDGFKIVQESLVLTRVVLVTSSSFDRANVAAIVTGFKRRLGAEVTIEVEFVDAIPAEKSGKHRYVVSHVPGSHRAAATQVAEQVQS